MNRSPLAILALVLPLFSTAGPAAAYQVVTTDGRKLEAAGLAQVGTHFRLETEAGTVELPPGSVDFYATFRANTGVGNVVAFVPGGFLRFESLSFSKGLVTLELAEGRSISVQEAIVDFRTSVLEGSFVLLPADRSGSLSVAKATEAAAPPRQERAGRSERSRNRAKARKPRNVPSREGGQTQGSR